MVSFMDFHALWLAIKTKNTDLKMLLNVFLNKMQEAFCTGFVLDFCLTSNEVVMPEMNRICIFKIPFEVCCCCFNINT